MKDFPTGFPLTVRGFYCANRCKHDEYSAAIIIGAFGIIAYQGAIREYIVDLSILNK
jgi:hypothetical protein